MAVRKWQHNSLRLRRGIFVREYCRYPLYPCYLICICSVSDVFLPRELCELDIDAGVACRAAGQGNSARYVKYPACVACIFNEHTRCASTLAYTAYVSSTYTRYPVYLVYAREEILRPCCRLRPVLPTGFSLTLSLPPCPAPPPLPRSPEGYSRPATTSLHGHSQMGDASS